ncbi:hypothetical protein G5I_07750 [Acromyrmex echinatior]|uniref:Uncharacterized protein n=1 Tax=Acromyrmex echinatior TaxID=103372 RepID=F4WPN1_ACREC|nr:hypothetical protein G5I_07750 [Acromyrmex echinatior]
MRENREGMEGRSDSISQVYARRRTSVSHTHLLSPGMWVNVRRNAVPLDSANVGPTFSVKELNPFDPGLDLVLRSQVFEGSKCESGYGEERIAGAHRDEVFKKHSVRCGISGDIHGH